MRNPNLATIDRRAFLGGLVLGALTFPLAAEAQMTGRVYTIGILSSGSPSGFADVEGAFREALARLGYVEKRNLVIQYRFAEGASGRLRDFTAELVRMNVDALVTNGTPARLAAKEATSSIPIVTLSTADPVSSGLVRSLGRPGGNITGVSAAYADIAGKWIELLRDFVPHLARIAFLGNADNPINKIVFRRAQAIARERGVTIGYFSATKPDEVGTALTQIHQANVQGSHRPGRRRHS